jgi:Domain of unknown function (DUF6378)
MQCVNQRKKKRMTDGTIAVLTARNKTHGSFAENARHSQDLKRQFHAAPCWNGLHDVHKEALHMIALKLSRILSGQAEFDDHWTDIEGYARLGRNACGRRD